VEWTSINNALANNNLYATAGFADGTAEGLVPSANLVFSNFGFTLPDEAVIDGIEVTVERYAVGTNVEDRLVTLQYSGTTTTSPGKQKIDKWPAADATTQYGGTSDRWNRIWTPAEINGTDFGFLISAEGDGEDLEYANIDWIEATVYYHTEENVDSTGGAESDSTAPNVATFNPVISGSVLAGGHAPFNFPNIDSTGGSLVDGTAVVPTVSLFGQGAALLGDAADESFAKWPRSEGGSILNGTADVYKEANQPLLSKGGVLLNSFATPENYYDPKGGVLGVDATSELTFIYDSIIGGGVVLAPLSGVDPEFGEGGASASPSGEEYVLYADDEGTGGIAASGQAIVEITPLIGGGVKANGLADEYPERFPEISGGALATSEAGDHAIITPYWDTGEGGIGISGISFIDPYLPIGQADLGGTADAFLSHYPELKEYEWISYLSGGQVVPPETNDVSSWAYTSLNPTTNEFTWDIRFSWTGNTRILTIRGPADYGTTGDIQLRIGQLSGSDWESPVQGSTTLTEEQKTDLLNGLWYWSVQTWDFENLRAQIVPLEGAQTGGQILQTYAQFMDGGAFGTQPEEPTEWFYYLSDVEGGGSFVGGVASVSIESAISGGSQVNGEAAVTVTYNITPESGVLGGGDVVEGLIYEHPVEGGVILGVDTPTSSIAPAIGGGAKLNSTLGYSFTANFLVTGGALVEPYSIQQFTDFIDGTGGARVGGKTIGERIRTFTSLHLNYGYAMASENIFTKVTYEKELIPPTDDETPELPEDYFRIQHEPGWCDVEERCEEGTLPETQQRRQEPYLPPKITRVTPRDRGITRVAL
jgi:hypothetical protein